MEGMGEEKLYFLLLELVKGKKKPSLEQSVSIHFVTDCSFSLSKAVAWLVLSQSVRRSVTPFVSF